MTRRTIIAIGLLLASCTAAPTAAGDAVVDVPSEPLVIDPPGPSPSPAPPSGSTPRPGDAPESWAPTSEQLAALGVVLTGGFLPHAHLGVTNGVPNWPPQDQMPEAIGDPPVPEGLGPLLIEARIERSPISCIEWMRTIASVDVGPGAAARAMEAEIVRVADAEHGRFLSWFGVEEDCDGLDPGALWSIGNTYLELAEEPCELAGGPRLRCFVLAGFGYPPGAAHSYLRHYQLVFDTTTGERLELDDVFSAAGIDAGVGRELAEVFVRAVAEHPDPVIRQARPTGDGLLFGFSPYEAGPFSEYTRDALIPWELFDAPDVLGRTVLGADVLAAQEWRTECTRKGEWSTVELSEPVAKYFLDDPIVAGGRMLQYVAEPEEIAARTLSVDLSLIARMDLDGDRAHEVAVHTHCFLGNGSIQTIEVWGVDRQGLPVQLPPALSFSKSDGYVLDMTGDGDALVITMQVGAPGDMWPHLNGYPFVRITEHRFDGVKWTMTVRSMLEQLDI